MGLILLIYTTPERLLNALALCGYFGEAASKKAPAGGCVVQQEQSENHYGPGRVREHRENSKVADQLAHAKQERTTK